MDCIISAGQALEADPLVAEALAAEPFLGVLGVDLSLEDLSSLIGRANLWSSSRALVVDEFWNLIASSNGHFDVSGIAESEDPLLKGVLEYFRGGYSLPDGARVSWMPFLSFPSQALLAKAITFDDALPPSLFPFLLRTG